MNEAQFFAEQRDFMRYSLSTQNKALAIATLTARKVYRMADQLSQFDADLALIQADLTQLSQGQQTLLALYQALKDKQTQGVDMSKELALLESFHPQLVAMHDQLPAATVTTNPDGSTGANVTGTIQPSGNPVSDVAPAGTPAQSGAHVADLPAGVVETSETAPV